MTQDDSSLAVCEEDDHQSLLSLIYDALWETFNKPSHHGRNPGLLIIRQLSGTSPKDLFPSSLEGLERGTQLVENAEVDIASVVGGVSDLEQLNLLAKRAGYTEEQYKKIRKAVHGERLPALKAVKRGASRSDPWLCSRELFERNLGVINELLNN